MESNTYCLNLLERPFEAIKNGTKKVEVRANKEGTQINNMKPGDKIIFKKCGTDETLCCTVSQITLYDSVRQLLITEGVTRTLSSGKDLEDGIKSIESIPGYKDIIKEYGVFAITLIFL